MSRLSERRASGTLDPLRTPIVTIPIPGTTSTRFFPARARQTSRPLFLDYRTNVASYPRWQKWLREVQPKMLVVWGKYDPSFSVAGATAYADDVPGAEIHILDAGHFALDEATDEIALLVRGFLERLDRQGG